MGFDVSHHPIKENEIQEWFFDAIKDNSLIEKLAEQFKIPELYKEKYQNIISSAKEIENKDGYFFDNSYGFLTAIVQGLFRTYFYTRGSAFSFILEEYPEFNKYIKPWQDIIKQEIKLPIYNKITENYTSGVFISNDGVNALLTDYENNSEIRQILDSFYSDQRIDVFLKALRFAQQNQLGLLEATEVIEPNPLDLNNSHCLSNLFNCDPDGALLYQETALVQLREIEESQDMAIDPTKVSYKKAINGEIENNKLSFWQKLKKLFFK